MIYNSCIAIPLHIYVMILTRIKNYENLREYDLPSRKLLQMYTQNVNS